MKPETGVSGQGPSPVTGSPNGVPFFRQISEARGPAASSTRDPLGKESETKKSVHKFAASSDVASVPPASPRSSQNKKSSNSPPVEKDKLSWRSVSRLLHDRGVVDLKLLALCEGLVRHQRFDCIEFLCRPRGAYHSSN